LRAFVPEINEAARKRKRITEEQIIGILKEHEAGVPVADLCRKHGVSVSGVPRSPS
jgi:hypothetical protein